jgi:ferrous iron transport protein B
LLGGSTERISGLFDSFTAFVFLVFTLLYTPCVAAMAAVRREMGSRKSMVVVVITQCVIAWIIAFIVRIIGTILGF